jgi:hypothetical protein
MNTHTRQHHVFKLAFCMGLAALSAHALAAEAAPEAAAAASAAKASDALASSPKSARGDYVGDCFIIKNKIPVLPSSDSRQWIVTSQDNATPEDPTLTLVPASDWGPGFIPEMLQRILPIGGCNPKTSSTEMAKLPASTLQDHGAIRRGFVYGVLTTPYKYYPSDKQFEAGLPIGPYLGWRIGQSGVGGTFVAALTLGSVKASTLEPDPSDSTKTRVTGSTNVMAMSGAVGLVFDITRNSATSPFKVGLLVGQDFVNDTPNIRYDHNRKRWMAVQIGYDFTDY